MSVFYTKENENSSLNVLMMGGRRCGKTSALASMFDQIKNGDVKRYFEITDETIREKKNGEVQDSLKGKILELKNFLRQKSNKTFLVDSNPTNSYWDYKLKLQIPGTQKKMFLNFRDANGEFFVRGGAHQKDITEYIKTCDVFVVAVDTPYLMGPIENENICPECINECVNRTDDIREFLTNIDTKDGADAKMVVFVPLKCEKWCVENKLDSVVSRVKEVYKDSIDNMLARNMVSIAIVPIQTVGSIVFSEFKEAYCLKFANGETKRCCKLADNLIRLEDGTLENIQQVDDKLKLNKDIEAKVDDADIYRPYEWFVINHKDTLKKEDERYAPQNCDQLPIHILRFMLKKFQNAEQSSKSKNWFMVLLERIRIIFGDISIDELEKTLEEMRKQGDIKEERGSIEYIRDCFKR